MRNRLAILIAAFGLFLVALPAYAAKPPSDTDRGWNAYFAGRYADAMQFFMTGARSGDSSAMNGIGILYDNGYSVDLDHKMAARWYEEAVKRGDNSALINLGWIYERGLSGIRDEKLGLGFYETAVKRGNYEALSYLGYYYEQKGDYAFARRWYEAAVGRNVVLSYVPLALLYTEGRGGAVEYCKAMDIYRKGLAANDAASINNLGLMYYRGQCVAANEAQARKYYKISANLGDPIAKQNLAALDTPPPVYRGGGNGGAYGGNGCDAYCETRNWEMNKYTEAAVAASYIPPPPVPPAPTINSFYATTKSDW